MGVHSTMCITREDAIKEIINRLDTASDEEIAEALFGIAGNKLLFNFWIVQSYENEDMYPHSYTKGGL